MGLSFHTFGLSLWQWTSHKKLELKCESQTKYRLQFCPSCSPTNLKTSGDLFLSCSFTCKSMSLLKYEENSFHQGTIYQIGQMKKERLRRMTAVEFISEDTFLGSDTSNILSFQREFGVTSDNKRRNMNEMGRIHIRERINVFRYGSFIKKNLVNSSIAHSGGVLFGTAQGAIGIVTQVSKGLFEFLHELQKNLAPIGRILQYVQNEDSKGFINGDIIESFLDLSKPDMEKVASGMQLSDSTGMKTLASVDDVIKLVLDLRQIQ